MPSQNDKENSMPATNDDFWDISENVKKRAKDYHSTDRHRPSVSAVDLNITQNISEKNTDEKYQDSSFSFEKNKSSNIGRDETSLDICSNSENTEKVCLPDKNTCVENQTQKIPDNNAANQDSQITDGENSNQEYIIKKYIPPHKPSVRNNISPIIEYTPDNALIRQIRIFPSSDGTVINRNILFARERDSLLQANGKQCEPTGYFSFSPRYSQLTKSQLSWYLWWRENMRNDNYIQTDYAYIKLYIMELLAADENEDIDGCLDKLCKIFINNHDSVLGFMYLGKAISDFCMLHRLNAPSKILAPYMQSLIFHHVSDEFYLGPSKENRDIYPQLAIKYISVYNSGKSKFATGENKELFDRHIRNAISEVFNNNDCYDIVCSKAAGAYSTVVTERKLYDGQRELVSKDARIETTAFPVSCIQGIITDTIRYAENKIRDHLGIRSKLSILTLDKVIKNVIDAYFDKALPRKSTQSKNKEQNKSQSTEYDIYYDLPKTTLSIENATKIEQSSWGTTKILIETFENKDNMHSPDSVKDKPDNRENTETETHRTVCTNNISEILQVQPDKDKISPVNTHHPDSEQAQNEYDILFEALGNLSEFISLCREQNIAGQRQFALSHGVSCDEIADIINENAVNILGDIILEEDSGGYKIISEYLHVLPNPRQK